MNINYEYRASLSPDVKQMRRALWDVLSQIAADEMDDFRPDWRIVMGAVAEGKRPVETPFRKWLATKDKAYQNLINNTISSQVLLRSIGRFEVETTA